jgi:hypothetical protein
VTPAIGLSENGATFPGVRSSRMIGRDLKSIFLLNAADSNAKTPIHCNLTSGGWGVFDDHAWRKSEDP